MVTPDISIPTLRHSEPIPSARSVKQQGGGDRPDFYLAAIANNEVGPETQLVYAPSSSRDDHLVSSTHPSTQLSRPQQRRQSSTRPSTSASLPLGDVNASAFHRQNPAEGSGLVSEGGWKGFDDGGQLVSTAGSFSKTGNVPSSTGGQRLSTSTTRGIK